MPQPHHPYNISLHSGVIQLMFYNNIIIHSPYCAYYYYYYYRHYSCHQLVMCDRKCHFICVRTYNVMFCHTQSTMSSCSLFVYRCEVYTVEVLIVNQCKQSHRVKSNAPLTGSMSGTKFVYMIVRTYVL